MEHHPMNEVTKDKSSKQEKAVAEYLGGNVVVGSGARQFHPGDVLYGRYLIECKTHMQVQDTIVFKRRFWDKIKDEATSQFKVPMLVTDNGTQKIKNTFCILPYNFIHPYFRDEIIYEVSLNMNIRTNLIFQFNDMKLDLCKDDSFAYCYNLDWGCDKVSVLPLCAFKQILEDD